MYFRILQHLCFLHLRQVYRLLAEIGLARILILIFILFVFSNQFEPLVNFSSPWMAFLPLVFVLPILRMQDFEMHPSIHNSWDFKSSKVDNEVNGPNKESLKDPLNIPIIINPEMQFYNVLGIDSLKIRMGRNLVFAIPGFIILSLNGNWTALFISLLIILIIAFPFRLKMGLRDSNSKRLFRFKLLPWTVGVSNSLPMLLLVLVLLCLAFLNIAFLFIAIFLFHFITIGFFTHNEPQILLESYGKRAKAFLTFYIKKHLGYYSLVSIIFIVVSLIISPELSLITIAIILLLSLHQLVSIYLKFCFYEPGKTNDQMQSIQTLMLVFLLIPFTIPIPFWYTWKYRKKAIENLKVYL